MNRLLIHGGTVVSATGSVAADVLVDAGRIVALAEPGSDISSSFATGDTRRIDASARLVVPGGLDVHTHMEMPFGGTHTSDTFETGTRAAAWGGTTTIIDFAIQRRGEALRQGLDAWLAKAEGNCAIDYGFHMIVSDVNDQSMKEMDMLVDEGVTSFKLFMAYPGVFYSTDAEILRAMQQASGDGATIMMHAENGIAIDLIVAETLREARPIRVFTPRAGPRRSRARRRSAPSGLPGSRVRRSTSSTCLPPKRSKPSCTRATRGGMCSLRPVRSICFSRTPISNGPGSRGPSMSARHPCAPSGIRPSSGAG